MKFEELDLSYDILDALDAMHFDECTAIQEQAIPRVLEGRDLIATAQTGTGKTAAYLLPIIDLIAEGGFPKDAINCVVMAPTRELAQQIDRQMEGFAYYMPVSSMAIYGGTDGATYARQQRGLKSGADVVIATPGRLIAHLSMGYVDLSQVSFFVLDEADRMLDMGFYEDIVRIASNLPADCQTLMFSATMPDKIQQLAKRILKNPAEIKIAVSKPAEKIDQSAFICHDTEKNNILKDLFARTQARRVIVFASSKLKVKELTRALKQSGHKVAEIHSDLDQDVREQTLLDFKANRVDILVATDILARGIDIDDISMVVNYDVPRDAEDYVHRIGRTARAGSEGRAVTLVGSADRRKFAMIERFIGKKVRRESNGGETDENPQADEPRSGREKGRRNDGKGRRNQGKGPKKGSGRSRKDQPAAGRTEAAPEIGTCNQANAPEINNAENQTENQATANQSEQKPARSRRNRNRSRKPKTTEQRPDETVTQTPAENSPAASGTDSARQQEEAGQRKRRHRGGRRHRRPDSADAPAGSAPTPATSE